MVGVEEKGIILQRHSSLLLPSTHAKHPFYPYPPSNLPPLTSHPSQATPPPQHAATPRSSPTIQHQPHSPPSSQGTAEYPSATRCCDSNERAPRTVINRTEIQKRKNTKLSKSPKGREYPCREDQVWVCVETPDQLADSDLPHDWQKRLKSKTKHGDNLRKPPIAGGVSYIYLYVGET